jgi:hypothetical protein
MRAEQKETQKKMDNSHIHELDIMRSYGRKSGPETMGDTWATRFLKRSENERKGAKMPRGARKCSRQNPVVCFGIPRVSASLRLCVESASFGGMTRLRHTAVGEFVVAGPETFGTACPKADKQWH